MKKLFFGLTLLIVLIIGGAYGLLFTAPGNSFVASMIEDKVITKLLDEKSGN